MRSNALTYFSLLCLHICSNDANAWSSIDNWNNTETVYAKFVNLNPGKANSPANFIIKLALQIDVPWVPLAISFDKPLQTGVLPDAWKQEKKSLWLIFIKRKLSIKGDCQLIELLAYGIVSNNSCFCTLHMQHAHESCTTHPRFL